MRETWEPCYTTTTTTTAVTTTTATTTTTTTTATAVTATTSTTSTIPAIYCYITVYSEGTAAGYCSPDLWPLTPGLCAPCVAGSVSDAQRGDGENRYSAHKRPRESHQRPGMSDLPTCLSICLFACLSNLPVCLYLQVMLLIDIELAYMNTNHEDFLGFAK